MGTGWCPSWSGKGTTMTKLLAVGAALMLLGAACSGDSPEPTASSKAAISATGEADPLHSSSLPKPKPNGSVSTLAPPSEAELNDLMSKQQQYLQEVQKKLKSEWKNLSPADFEKARAALKRQILGV